MQFAEYELEVDVIMIRPLSELGSDIGSMEDLRDIVPFESQIKDALESYEEYIQDFPRKVSLNNGAVCDIRVEPDTFKAVRPDPSDCLIRSDNKIYVPRRRYWHNTSPDVDVSWELNCARITYNASGTAYEAVDEVLVSDSFPVPENSDLLFSADIKKVTGTCDVLIMSPSGEIFATARLNEGKSADKLNIPVNTRDADRFYISINQSKGDFELEIDFHHVRTPERGILKEFKLPIPRRWQIDSAGVKVDWVDTTLTINTEKELAKKYLYKTYSTPCLPDSRIRAKINVNVLKGALVIGVLTEDFQNWVIQQEINSGKSEVELDFNTGSNRQLQFVLINKNNQHLEAEINWGDMIDVEPQRRFFGTESKLEKVKSADGLESRGFAGALSRFPGWFKKDKRESKIKFYCQKPWTDVNNFSVDGRMDVCCITTGASQTEYQIGNINDDTFQEIWNGPQMRNFRRTVNTDFRLPPCQRCPMAHSYQGLFFDKKYTFDQFEHKLRSMMIPVGIIGKILLPVFERPCFWLLEIMFKGFKK